MAARKRASVDLTGVRQRGGTWQVRVFGGIDPVTGKQVMLTGSADTEAGAIEIRDGFRKQVRDRTAVRTNVSLRYLLDEWIAGHQVEPTTRATYALLIEKFIAPSLGDESLAKLAKLGPRPYERLYAELRTCRRRCGGRSFVEHRTPRDHECDARCKAHVCKPLAASSIRQCHAVLSSAFSAAVRWGWIAFNPMEAAQKPRPRAPQPRPAVGGGRGPHRGRCVGTGRPLGHVRLDDARDRRPARGAARAAMGGCRFVGRDADDPAQPRPSATAPPS